MQTLDKIAIAKYSIQSLLTVKTKVYSWNSSVGRALDSGSGSMVLALLLFINWFIICARIFYSHECLRYFARSNAYV